MNKCMLGLTTVLLTFATGCFAEPPEAPYKRGRDFDPANMEHLLYQYNKATNEQKSIAKQNIDSMEQLKKSKKWTSLYKTARGLLWAYPTPEALIYLGDAYLNTGVDGKDKRELIHKKK